MRRPRILVLSIGLGGGHRAIARSFARNLDLSSPGRYDVVLDDLSERISYGRHRLSRKISRVYDLCLDSFDARPYRALYDFADEHPRLISRLADQMFGRRAEQWLLGQTPDVVVSTYPLISFIVGRVFRDREVGVVSVVTDVGEVNRLWWAGGPDVHLNVTMTAQVADSALRHGVPADRIRNVGLIVDLPLVDGLGRSGASELTTDDEFRVLLTAGGQGYGPNLLRVAEKLARSTSDRPLRFLLAVGSNDELRARLRNVLGSDRVSVCPREGASLLLPCVDLVVGKAGWATLSECIVARKPFIVTDRIPGQEVGNARFAEQVGAARILGVDDAVRRILQYSKEPGSMRSDFRDCSELRGSDLPQRIKGVVDSAMMPISAARSVAL